ncbi:hypothetical protein SLS55_006728 [Diplodia seriata]|uniref:Protein kinase domain-containing protein n=1 Tax=Diplodia seriata TaxID=420778 RepID=A0ABR3CF01_9PEZI
MEALHRPVSRAYDLWSLGCLYLEFATWLIMGSEAIDDFSTHRLRPSRLDPKFSEDYFFTVVKDEAGGMDAEVRDGVLSWAQTLHEHRGCSRFIHDLVDLVMKHLLVIKAADRIHARDLCVRFNDFLKKAEIDDDYLCTPVPRSNEKNQRSQERVLALSL